MKAKTTAATRFDLIGNGRESDREIFNSVMKRWRQRIGYCSLFAAVSAALTGSLAEARSEPSKIADARVGQDGPRRQNLNTLFRNRSLLKRQSEFRLPHQNTSLLPAFAGNDDCPGKFIPGGTYTSGAPFTDSGDTTGANDTVNSLYYYYYWNIPAHGPDHVYSFTLTNLGANPEIKVSASTSTYKPMVYIIDGQYGRCPSNTGNVANWWWMLSYAQSPGGTITIDSQAMRYLPLGVPLYLFVDAPEYDAAGSGAYTVRMQDATVAQPCSAANPIDCPEFFVSQHYSDFLNRRPDIPGLNHWTNEVTECSDLVKRFPGESFELCTERKRANTSAAFFLSPEFQNTGSFVLRVYWGTLGKLLNAQCPGVPNGLAGNCRPSYSEYINDMNQIAQGIVFDDHLDPARINANKQAFVAAFVQRPEFLAIYGNLNNTQFVDKLFQTTGVTASSTDRQALINELNANAPGARASVVFKVVDGTTTITDGALVFNTPYGQAFYNQEFDTAFVFMEYLGYLQRNPDQPGYDHWLGKMRQYGNWVDAQMVLAFILSPEYRQRFGTP